MRVDPKALVRHLDAVGRHALEEGVDTACARVSVGQSSKLTFELGQASAGVGTGATTSPSVGGDENARIDVRTEDPRGAA